MLRPRRLRAGSAWHRRSRATPRPLLTAVSNAGPIIHLSWIDRLDLLQILFGEVLVPPAVQDELLRAGPHVPGIAAIRNAFATGWLTVRPLAEPAVRAALMTDLDRGESEAIALMRQLQAGVLLLDERRARAQALRERLPITGTLGVLRLARQRGLIRSAMPLLDELRRSGFRVSVERMFGRPALSVSSAELIRQDRDERFTEL